MMLPNRIYRDRYRESLNRTLPDFPVEDGTDSLQDVKEVFIPEEKREEKGD